MKSAFQKGLIILMPFLLLGCQIPFMDNGKIPRTDNDSGSIIDTGTGSDTGTGTDVETPVTYDDVTYNTTPKSVETASVVGGKEAAIAKAYGDQNGGGANVTTWSEVSYLFNFYDVGVVQAEQYKDWKLLLLDLSCDGMCMSHTIYRFAWNKPTNELILLTKASSEYVPAYFKAFQTGEDASTTISGQLPDKIQIPNTTKYLQLAERNYLYIFQTQTHTPEELGDVVFTDPTWGKIYHDPRTSVSCLQAMGPDGAISTYVYDPGFFGGKQVWTEWKDGSPKTSITDEYAYKSGGCGISGGCYLIEEVDENNLSLIGTTSTGFDLYEVNNPIEDAVDDKGVEKTGATTGQVTLAQAYLNYKSYAKYEAEQSGKKVLTFEEFLATKPLLYWKDPFDRWSAVMNNTIKPPAECGKPVIYLYPQKETDVSVKVDIDEFTATVPDYGTDGWNVHAYPNGEILNYADGKTYPYLFWEGKDSDTVNVTKGFVVERNKLEKFLKKSLKEMGLKGDEKSEFMDFWLPRMLENTQPYFFVSFLGTQDFNKIAPLEISPKPDTLIRIFMYFEPLNTKIKVVEQELKSVKRKGFTVVEWGGTSNTSWKY